MSKTIIQVIGIDSTTLIVFVAQAQWWQLGLISTGRAVEAAFKVGLKWIA